MAVSAPSHPFPDRLGKTVTTRMARMFSHNRVLMKTAEKLELFSRTLQSKGVDTALSDQIRSISPVLPSDGAVVFDVGANIGNWTRELLRLRGGAVAAVHCFEPAPTNLVALRRLDDPRITLHPFGASARAEDRDFYSDFAGSGIASLFRRETPDSPPMALVETIPVRPLDSVVGELGIDRIDLVKMDIEGAELDALHGLSGSIAKGIVRAFTFEIGSVNIASRTYLSDFHAFARQAGFHVYRFTVGGGLHPIDPYRVSQECFATTNYLATRTPVPG